MRIALGADHRGREVLERLDQLMREHGHEVEVMRIKSRGMCDYPDVAFPVAQAVAKGQADVGILVCGSGIGMSIAANKMRGIRAALVHDEVGADMSRRHNDANVLCLPADLLGQRLIERIVEIWLGTTFEGGRHARRVKKIEVMEQGGDPRQVDEQPTQTNPHPAGKMVG
ncbi:MAG: ribose 5-phosphate isomerase B [Phycisphaeraceae bacterium]|nr:ribose 5-phosphate isomerase B [Phycisphaeraceae bacterium]